MRTRVALHSLAIVLVALGALGACASVRYNTDVAVVSLRVERLELFQATTVFTMRIDNQEPEPMILDGSTHELWIGGRRIGKGMLADRIEIPRLSSVRIEVPVEIATTALINPIRAAIDNRRFSYEVHSRLFVLAGSKVHHVDVSKTGEVNLESGDPSD